MIDGYKLTLDISYYQQAMDWAYIKNFVDGFVFRVTYGTHKDTKFKEHVQKALDAGYTHLASYMWLRPDQNIKAQLDAVRDHLYGTPVKFVFVDLEQHGQGYLNFPPLYSGEVMADKAWQMISGLTTMGVTPGIYSRSTWIESYAKPLKNWMYRYPVWLASYPFAGGRISLSWEDLLDKYAPKIFSPYYIQNWGADLRKASMWQWSGDKFVLPGVFSDAYLKRNMPVDLNYTSNSLFEMWRVAPDTTGTVPQPPVYQYEVWRCLAPLGIVVRNSPTRNGTDTLLRIKFNETVKVYEKVTAEDILWGRIGTNMWMALSWSRKESGDVTPPPQESGYELWQCKSSDGMRVRKTPSTSGVDTMIRIAYNATFKVYEKKTADGHVWGRIGIDQWVALTWSVKL